jgi:hypothetical protein
VSSPNPAGSSARTTTVVLAFGIGTLVAVGLGVYARVHDASFFAFNLAGFSSGTAAKAWLATVAFLFGLVQLFSALVMYGRIRIAAPPWIGTLHRWSGRIAFLLAVPVAIHCLYALGFQNYSTRVLLHSIFGCLFFGAFTVKMLILPKKGLSGWVLPFWGAVVFTALVLIWLTSAYWFFSTFGVHR